MATSDIIPQLSPGLVSIYGSASIYGFTHSEWLTFGRIYQLPVGNSGAFSLGQNVLFPFRNANSISYANTQYFLIPESEIILVEKVPDAAP